MPRPANPRLSTISPQLHTFDIDRTSVALSLWRNIERRQIDGSSVQSTSPNRSRPLLVDPPKQSLRQGPVGSSTSDAKVILTEGQRQHYFKATQPPQLSCKGKGEAAPATHSTLISLEPTCEESSRKLNPLLKSHGFELAELTEEWGSLSSEGRKQAEEAGLKLGCSIKRPMSHSPPEIPQKKAHQDRWAAYSRINTDPHLQGIKPPTEVKSHDADGPSQPHRPLLEVFEAELANLLGDESVPSAVERSETSAPHPKHAAEYLVPETTSDTRDSEIISGEVQDSPVEVFGQAVRGFIDGIGLLTSEVRSNIPDAREQLLNAQQNLPHVVQQTFFGALRGLGSHVHRFANNVQLASIRTRDAADRTRGFDTQALEGVISGLHGLAVGVGEIGEALFPGMTLESTTEPSEGQAEYKPGSTTAVVEGTTPAPELAHQVHVTVEDEAQTIDVAATVTGKCPSEDFTQPSLASTEANGDSDGSLGYPRRKDTDAEYEKIHRNKREEAADRREADRQRLRRMQQEADEASQPSKISTCSIGREGPTDEADHSKSAQEEKQYDQFKKARAADKRFYHPKPYCLFGCTSSSFCRHRRAPGGSPYPSRVDSFRNRPTRRSPLSYTQLPYEYVVPPPEFYDTSKSDSTSNPFRHNRGRFHLRSRLPATSSRESSQDKSTTSCDWPKVQRYGPIHFPHNARRPSDDTWTSQLPYSRSPRSLSPPSRWTDTRSNPPRVPTTELSWVNASSQSPRRLKPETHWLDTRSRNPRQPPPETQWANECVATTPAAYCPSVSQCGLIPANPAEGLASSHKDVRHHTGTLRHRQSWHPSSATKTPERWNMTCPERPTVSFVESDGVSSLPSWKQVLQHRRSTGLFTSPRAPYSATRDLPLPVSGAQIKATQPNVQTKLPYPAYPWYYSSQDENMEKRTAHGELDNEKLWRVGRDPFEFVGPRPSVNSPWNDAQDSLQPLPAKTSNLPLPVRAGTAGNSTPKGELDMSSELPSLSSVLGSSSIERIAPELKRFPTLAQFESEASKTLPPFPPLPTMEPLITVRTDAKLNGPHGPKDADKTGNKTDVSMSRRSSLNHGLTKADAPQMNESSGQFFRRMTGLGTSSLAHSDEMAPAADSSLWPLTHGADIKDRTAQNPPRYKCPFCDQAFGRLDNHWTHLSTHSKRWNPHASQIPDYTQDLFPEMASNTSHQAGQSGLNSVNTNDALGSLIQGQPTRPATLKPQQGESRLTSPFDPLAESVTLHRSRLIDNFRRTTAQRRSFHDYYAGNRRPYSEYFTGTGRLGWESFLAKHENASGRLPTPTDHPTLSVPTEKAVVPETSESMPRSETPIYNAGEHYNVKTVEKVQECVDQLRSLGFGTIENGGEARLLVYAQAAEGILEDAIETIEEERKAYKQRSRD